MADREVIVMGTGLQGLSAALQLSRAGAKVTLLRGPTVAMGAFADDEFHEGFALGACPHPPISVSQALLRKMGVSDLNNDGFMIPLYEGEAEETLVLPMTPAQAASCYNENPALYETFWRHLGQVALLLASALENTPHHQTRSWQDIWHVYGTAAMLAAHPPAIQKAFSDLFTLSVADYAAQNLSSESYQKSLISEIAFDLQSNPLAPGSAAGLLDIAWQSIGGLVMRTGVESLRARLRELCLSAGVKDMTGLEPLALILEQGIVRGVKLAEGQELRAARVLSDIPVPQILIDLVPEGAIPLDIKVRLDNETSRTPIVRLKIALNDWPASMKQDQELAITGYRMVGLDPKGIAQAYGEARTQIGSSTPILHIALVEPMDDDTRRPAISVLGAYVDPGVERTTNNRLAAAKAAIEQLKNVYPDIEPAISGFAVFLGAEIERIFGVQPRTTTKGGAGFSSLLSQAQSWQHLQSGHNLQNLYLIGQGPESVISCFHSHDVERAVASVLSDLAI